MKILLVEDQAFFRDLLVRVIEAEPKLELISSVADGETAVELARKTSPDVVIIGSCGHQEDLFAPKGRQEIG